MTCLRCLVSSSWILETGKKFSQSDRNKATKAVKKVIDNEKRSGARGIFTMIGLAIAGAVAGAAGASSG